MGAKEIARRMSHAQRELLIAHVPAHQPLDNTVSKPAADRRRTSRSLIGEDLLRYETASKRPMFSVLTELGREVAAIVLSEYAEALILAGYTGLESPVIELKAAG